MSETELSVDQLLTLLNNKVRNLSTSVTKDESTLARVETELRFTVNAIRPVNRLPSEVLNEIFASLHPRILRCYRPLIHAAHVCSLWRNVILSTPGHWTWVNPKWPNLLSLSLRLSEPAGIEAEVSTLRDFTHSFVDDLLPHCERITSFTLAFPAATRTSCSRIVSRLRCMPNLHKLSILANSGVTSYSLPILSENMPSLESVTLPFSPYKQGVIQLAFLTTINITVDNSALADVIELFVNNPKLRSATLCGTFRNKSCQRQHGTVRMNSLRQLGLFSWGATSLLPFLELQKGAHITFGPRSHVEIIGTWDLFPMDPTFFPNLVGLKQVRCYILECDTVMEFTGPNGGISLILPRPETYVFGTDSFPVAGVKELYCEFYSTTGTRVVTDEIKRVIASMVPTMNQLRKVTFARCTNSMIQVVLSNISRSSPLKTVTLLHCDDPGPPHDIFQIVNLFARGRSELEVRVIWRDPAQQGELLDHALSKAVKSFWSVHQSSQETLQAKFEIRREFPASIRKTEVPAA